MANSPRDVRPAGRWRLALIAAAVVACIGWWQWSKADPKHDSAQLVGKAGGETKRPVVPVVIAAPQKQDFPIYAVGLGNVVASQTVAVHTQVDGKLDQVLFTEGQFVKKGDVLARIDPRLYQAALDQAKAKKAQDVALLGAARKDLERFKTLAIKSYQSQQSIDNQIAKVDQLAATVAADEALIETAETQLDYTAIKAPTDGRMGVRLIDAGNFVRAADAGSITTLMQTRPAAVLFSLPAQKLDAIREAMSRGAVEVTALDQDNRKTLATGQLLLIDNAIDTTTAMVRLKAIFPNEDNQLWPGQFVNAKILVETKHEALTIPNAAIQRGANGLLVWVIDEANTARARTVEIGPATDDATIVLSGLKATDRVVINGQYKLSIGAPVSIGLETKPTASNGGRT